MMDWAYLLVTPDGVIGGAVPGIMARLRQHGLDPGASLVMDLRTEAMEQVYQESEWHISNPGYADVTFPWDMHGNLYRLSPACLIMLPLHAGQTFGTLLACKGNTLPELAGPDTIRWAGENVIFNLVHCPDDALSAYRELSILVGPDAAARLIAVTQSPNPDLDGLLGAADLVGCLPAVGGPEAISFAAIANKVRQRVLHHLALGLHDSPGTLDSLAIARRQLLDEHSALAAADTSGARLDHARHASAGIHRNLAVAAEKYGDELVIDGLAALDELYRLAGGRDVAAIFALASRGVYFSPLEKVIVESHQYAFRPGPQLVEIYPADVPPVD